MGSPLADSIFDLMDRINAAPSVAAAWDTYMGAAQQVGLDYGVACFLPANRSLGETIFAQDCPQDWLDHYLREGHEAVDPVIARVHQSIGPFLWNLKEWDGLLVGQQISWAADNRAADITGGMVIPDRRDGHLKLVSLFGPLSGMDPMDQQALHYAGLETAMRMHELGVREEGGPYAHLSPREKECLHWMAAGKSDADIGVILSISDKTVATHIDRAKQKFGVRTRAQALVIALRLGHLHP